ncbi:23S rRNA (uridine(2552)-2'-O)-methyltransferase RlmE [Solemya elarraichensis gill symbiont]|uniref:Ribosomal RNA large subunit methyltransferase E n=1 Tax=Solemya elarraichensis gill symbiont TaxID=1918949 RepID=A0A1T2L1F0_9GAMM|nr:23S rRNA (uridine(2552)-2'-O)-methyltransferase RlmE [Solemya elarraichensis gill symbiont]OOZ38840.1 23S rRNA methyltransferase [Solemya elarraichensis gill symbiont]
MARSKSSGRWMQRHINDHYVKQAQREGYRSRAAYKLLELLEKDRLIKPGMVVVDLGAAPGGWSQVAAKLVGDEGMVFALDSLPMDALPGVTIIEGDFTEKKPHDALVQALDGRQVDVVISDIAPNITGMAVIDQPRSMYLCELALDFACNNLKPGGDFVAKVFQGEGFDEFYRELRSNFQRVVTRKPQASRAKSREVYVVARGLKV